MAICIRRRELIVALGGAAVAWPLAARAQGQPMPVIGYLRSGWRAAPSQVEAAFRQGLSSMGFIDGRTVAIDYQYAENQNDRLMALTADLLRQPVAVIYAGDNITAGRVQSGATPNPRVFLVLGPSVHPRRAPHPHRPHRDKNRLDVRATAPRGDL